MAAADRRRAILGAAVPLFIKKGAAVTTAQIAHAAGIAEGTIFRAFPDKSALLFEAVKATMDPASVSNAIRAIGTSCSLEMRLAEAAGLLRGYLDRVSAIGECLRSMSTNSTSRQGEVSKLIKESSASITSALMEFFELHRAALRVSPASAVAAFRGLVFASVHPLLPPRDRLKAEEVACILLSGIALNRNK
jgi:AcrR family transcriptional regulator